MSKKPNIIHLKKFADGRTTPQDVHRTIGIRKHCEQCGAPATVRIKVLIELNELVKRQPEFVAQIMASNPNGSYVPTIPTKHGQMVKISDVGACHNCQHAAEVAAARGPSWAIVEIDKGPEHAYPVHVQVPGHIS